MGPLSKAKIGIAVVLLTTEEEEEKEKEEEEEERRRALTCGNVAVLDVCGRS